MNEKSTLRTSPKLEEVRAQFKLEEKMKGAGMGYELATVYRSQRRYTEATQEIKGLIRSENEIGYKVALVDIYLENEQIEQALLNIDEILFYNDCRSNHFYFLILILKTECLLSLSRTDEALACIEEAQRISQEDEVLAWKGIAHMKKNEIEFAKNCFDRSISYNNHNEKAWLGVGSVHCLKGDYELGLACYKRAQDIDSDNLIAAQLMAKFVYYGNQI